MASRHRYNSDTFQRLNQIGGADLALRYAEISEAAARDDEPEAPEVEESVPAARDESRGLGLDGWLNKLQQEFPLRARPRTDTAEPLDDLSKMKRFMELDRLYLFSLPRIMPGKADASLLQELREIANGYDQLRKAGPHGFGLYTGEQLATRIADVHASMAGVCESMRDDARAEKEYAAAIEMYTGLGKHDQVQSCRTGLARLQEARKGGANQEFKRLQAELAKRRAGSLEHAQTLIELAGLHRRNDDDQEAEKLYLQAERILDKLGGDPSGGNLAGALAQSLLSLQGGLSASGPSSIGTAMQTRVLYRELCMGLARIYQTSNPDLARHYTERAAQRDSRQQNDEFSAAMIRALRDELGKL